MTPHFDQMRIFAVTLMMSFLVVLFGFGLSGCVSASQKKAVVAATAANTQADDADKFVQKVQTEGMTPENQNKAVDKIKSLTAGLRKCATDVVDIQKETEQDKDDFEGLYLKTLYTLIGLGTLNILYVIFRFRKTILSWAASAIQKV